MKKIAFSLLVSSLACQAGFLKNAFFGVLAVGASLCESTYQSKPKFLTEKSLLSLSQQEKICSDFQASSCKNLMPKDIVPCLDFSDIDNMLKENGNPEVVVELNNLKKSISRFASFDLNISLKIATEAEKICKENIADKNNKKSFDECFSIPNDFFLNARKNIAKSFETIKKTICCDMDLTKDSINNINDLFHKYSLIEKVAEETEKLALQYPRGRQENYDDKNSEFLQEQESMISKLVSILKFW